MGTGSEKMVPLINKKYVDFCSVLKIFILFPRCHFTQFSKKSSKKTAKIENLSDFIYKPQEI
jgi:hypothetical protein